MSLHEKAYKRKKLNVKENFLFRPTGTGEAYDRSLISMLVGLDLNLYRLVCA